MGGIGISCGHDHPATGMEEHHHIPLNPFKEGIQTWEYTASGACRMTLRDPLGKLVQRPCTDPFNIKFSCIFILRQCEKTTARILPCQRGLCRSRDITEIPWGSPDIFKEDTHLPLPGNIHGLPQHVNRIFDIKLFAAKTIYTAYNKGAIFRIIFECSLNL